MKPYTHMVSETRLSYAGHPYTTTVGARSLAEAISLADERDTPQTHIGLYAVEWITRPVPIIRPAPTRPPGRQRLPDADALGWLVRFMAVFNAAGDAGLDRSGLVELFKRFHADHWQLFGSGQHEGANL
jgi:hypothetical protein